MQYVGDCENMMTSTNGNIFRVTGGLPSQKPVTQRFEGFLPASEQTAKQTIETPVIWEAIALIVTSL